MNYRTKHAEAQELTGHIQEILQHSHIQNKTAQEIIDTLLEMLSSYKHGRIKQEMDKVQSIKGDIELSVEDFIGLQ